MKGCAKSESRQDDLSREVECFHCEHQTAGAAVDCEEMLDFEIFTTLLFELFYPWPVRNHSTFEHIFEWFFESSEFRKTREGKGNELGETWLST